MAEVFAEFLGTFVLILLGCGVVGSGAVKIRIDQRYALKDVAQAHRDLEARKTTGCSILIP